MRDETKLIRATLTPAVAGEPLHAGPVFASPFHLAGNATGEGYTYGRSHNPTWAALEAAIAVLEGGGGRVFASGLAAVAAVFGTVLRPGDTVVMPRARTLAARSLLREFVEPMGVQVRVGLEDLAGARLVWLETPSNPGLEITDVRACVRVAHAAGALVAVDNTTATPLGQKPLELGADFSVCSDSKSMCGHSDLVLGHVAVRDAEWLGNLDRYRTLQGAIPGPMEAWLALRSLATLPLRLERSCANALALARMLAERGLPVVYPGLETHPGHDIARGQMAYFGPVLGVTLPDQAAAERFLARAKLVTEATSFGGITTTAERRGRWGHDAVEPGFLRVSAGCEAAEDLLADFAEALDGGV